MAKAKAAPNGSRSRGKKARNGQARWDAVAEAVYDIMNIEELPEVQPFADAEDDDKMVAYAAADALIRLVDALITPAVRKGVTRK